MAFDGLVTKSIVNECNEFLLGGRISKIHQPSESDIILQIRANGVNHRLLLSANASYPRFHLSKESLGNPIEPPMFCMLLRKHCEGAVIESISQVGMERIVYFELKMRDELGDWKRRHLVMEIMGRHSNILLVDPDRDLILDGIHHVTPGMSRHRVVLPGRPYIAPPEQSKMDPLSVNKEDFLSRLDFNSGKMDKQLVDHFSGVSPLVAREILFRSQLSGREGLWSSFESMMRDIQDSRYHPQIVETGEKSYFSVVELTSLKGKKQSFSSPSSCIEAYYFGKAERDAVKQRAHDLIRFASSELDKNIKKISKLENTLKESEQADQFRLFGELLTAHLHELQKGDTVAKVINYYEEEMTLLEIPLDPAKSPADNSQAYYRRYAKARNSIRLVQEQIELTYKEIEYFECIIQQLEGASVNDIEEIRDELVEGGYLRLRGKKNSKKKKIDKPQLERYISSEGIEILVGKNNKQNEYLTNRLASAMDTWLHTKDIPGSHVVIRAKEYNQQTLLEAAGLAAYFSKARGGSQIPIDYTLIKHVKKPSGTKPGFVIYEQQKTLFIGSDEEMVQRLRAGS
ncbi:MAG TPA: NFACT RNA binding domain-containing protein [Bacillota bacterium]|nr:NFACT RNA binding domain-containing protein [Bacillota bacterium]